MLDIQIKETPEELQALLPGLSPLAVKKVQLLYMLRTGNGNTLTEICRQLQINNSDASVWRRIYQMKGMDILLNPSRTRRSLSNTGQPLALELKPLIKAALTRRTFSRYVDLRDWLDKTHGEKIAAATVRKYVIELGLAHRILSSDVAVRLKATPAPAPTQPRSYVTLADVMPAFTDYLKEHRFRTYMEACDWISSRFGIKVSTQALAKHVRLLPPEIRANILSSHPHVTREVKPKAKPELAELLQAVLNLAGALC